MIDAADVGERADAIKERIRRAGGADVQLMAVTKGFDRTAIDAAVAAGLPVVGESYAQECVAKLNDGPRPDGLEVHFIGGLQRNKVKKLVGVVDVWHSVDRESLVEEIGTRAPGAAIFVQVDISNEATKGGCAPGHVAELVARAGERGLVVRGLMGIAPLGPPAEARPGFRLLRKLVDELGLRECSMGMSADLEVAIDEGSTMVRVGTGLFGPRPTRS